MGRYLLSFQLYQNDMCSSYAKQDTAHSFKTIHSGFEIFTSTTATDRLSLLCVVAVVLFL